jgi:hypothetical protein
MMILETRIVLKLEVLNIYVFYHNAINIQLTIFIMGLCILLRVLSRFVSKKTVLRNEYSRCFYLYSLSQHVSAYLMAILKWIVQNIKRSCYFYNGFVVFSAIMCVNCRQLISIVFLFIKFLNILLKYYC